MSNKINTESAKIFSIQIYPQIYIFLITKSITINKYNIIC